MATRLLYASLIRSIRPKTIVNGALLGKIQIFEFKNVLPACQLLHTKILDKDAGWDAQRQANIKVNLNDSQLEKNVPTAAKSFDSTIVAEPEPVALEGANETTDSADVFGNAALSNDDEDEADGAEEDYLNNPPSRSQRLSHIQYVRLIKEHLRARELKQAIEILEVRMKRDRVKPETYTYNLLISACAKAGYTRKAFSLFTKMRQRNLRATGGTYTSLLNACANAPSASDGINRANHVREIMLEKGVEPNVMNYNAMIKAYGRWGDVKSAFQIADEMKMKKLKPSVETFNFLLQACASDYRFGFRHCLLTWHKMLKSGFSPDYFSFHTVLRCVRDCGFGDIQSMQEVLKQILTANGQTLLDDSQKLQATVEAPRLLEKTEHQLEISDKTTTNNPFKKRNESAASPTVTVAVSSQSQNLVNNTESPPNFNDLEIPNLLAERPHLGSMLSLAEVTQPHERFLLLGGIIGFLELMKQNNITPNIQMFTTMLEVIPPTYAAEKQVLTHIRRIGLKADIDFFNVLIKKRSMRFDYEGAREVLSMIRTAGLEPDIVTYGVLALGCRTQEEARELLQEMREKGIRMNIQILGAMLRQGCAQRMFHYICEIMQISLDERIKPNDVFLRHLHNFYTQCARSIDARHPGTKTKNYKKQHAKFCDKYRLYQEEHGIAGLKLEDAIKVIKDGPYKQYKEENIEGLEPLKNAGLTQKHKIRKYIKKIKIDNLKDDDEQNVAKTPLLKTEQQLGT